MHYLKTLISYSAVNTLRLGYKNQSVNAVQGNNRCLFSDPYKTRKYILCGQNVKVLHVKPRGTHTVKCTLVQALRLCTGRTTHRGSRCIALHFLDHDTRRGEESASRSGRSLPSGKTHTHYTGGWVGPRAGLDRCGKSRPYRDSIPGPSIPQPVAIPTTLAWYIQ